MHHVHAGRLFQQRCLLQDNAPHVLGYGDEVAHLVPGTTGNVGSLVGLDPMDPDNHPPPAELRAGNEFREWRPAEFEPKRIARRVIRPGQRSRQHLGPGDGEAANRHLARSAEAGDHIRQEMFQAAQLQNREAWRTGRGGEGRILRESVWHGASLVTVR